MEAIILRQDFKQGTFGTLFIESELFCWTLERKWNNNMPWTFGMVDDSLVSCIPHGKYVCHKITSPKFGLTFEIENVDGRTNILFHWGNNVEDSKGCIMLGTTIGMLFGGRAVLSSRPMFDSFMKRLEGISSFNLRILELRL